MHGVQALACVLLSPGKAKAGVLQVLAHTFRLPIAAVVRPQARNSFSCRESGADAECKMRMQSSAASAHHMRVMLKIAHARGV